MNQPRIETGYSSTVPIAWVFELASMRDKSTGKYTGWREVIQVGRPVVPEGSIRNLRPLYAGEPEPYGGRT